MVITLTVGSLFGRSCTSVSGDFAEFIRQSETTVQTPSNIAWASTKVYDLRCRDIWWESKLEAEAAAKPDCGSFYLLLGNMDNTEMTQDDVMLLGSLAACVLRAEAWGP